MVRPQPGNVLDDDIAPTTTTTITNSTFLPIRGGVVMVSNNTARAEDYCSVGCNDESCQKDSPNLCGPDSDPNYCWVGCFCTADSGYRFNVCTCLCTA
ncbi:unnamed protein product [Linum trigynum]|uniref:Defensin-like protein n=1 Tax=Linum trigynum TaxID=586398 RepID=A0AAV2D3L8_9ROSI